MRWSKQLIPTLREVPQEAEIASHQLMLRAGLIRRLGAGLYTFLPMGLRALRKVERIIREEMDRAGALEVLMPALQPAEIWERTGRLDAMADVMFRISDRQSRALVLGPTHEEIITDLAAREIASYRDLPRNFYQIQTKFRDEIRPRFGLMRAKEFIMKDAYSFDADWDATQRSYDAMYEAYARIFQRCGLRTKIVEADTGAMGGSSSHEFMVLADSGEDGIVECDGCSYAANLERAESRTNSGGVFEGADKSIDEVRTPETRTIEEVAKFFKSEPGRQIKTLIYVVDGKPVAVLCPGDREINEIKLARTLNAGAVELADDATIEEATGAPVGFAGPVGLGIPVYADIKLKGIRGAITGANKEDAHIVNVDLDRDAKVKEYADLTFAKAGDGCPRCEGGHLVEQRGVEVGHVFKLGTKYSEALGARYLDADGKEKPVIMGCYGIGVTRTLQAVIEQSHDKDGIVWPMSVAPYEVEVLAISAQDPETMRVCDEIVTEAESAGIEVLFDDRDDRPGVKFKDADLVGLPLRLSVGERSLAKGVVEIKCRETGEVEEVPVANASAVLLQRVTDLKSRLS
ncbi:MAG: proline--tRNA ligase [Verrucomicrobia bacterium]|nr:proline--tRNA ligase [Verrucomicrobiota bacterium]